MLLPSPPYDREVQGGHAVARKCPGKEMESVSLDACTARLSAGTRVRSTCSSANNLVVVILIEMCTARHPPLDFSHSQSVGVVCLSDSQLNQLLICFAVVEHGVLSLIAFSVVE